MLEYAFVNLNKSISYITDNSLVFRGTWSGSTLYSPPVETVDFSTGKYIVLVQNTNTPPPNSSSWSELVIRGTISPTDPFQIAQTALETANAASVLALASSGTASEALGLANEALTIAVAGTNLAQTAYNIAVSGTVAGTNVPIPQGTNLVFVAGLNLGYAPSSVVCTVRMPDISGLNLWATLVGPPSSDGFTVQLNGTTDNTGYYLNWLARK